MASVPLGEFLPVLDPLVVAGAEGCQDRSIVASLLRLCVYRFQSLDASKRTHTHTIDKMQSAKRNTCNVTRLCIDEKNSTVHRCVSCRLDLSSFVPDFASLDLLLPTHSFSTSGLVPSSTEYASWTTVHSHF